MRRRRQPKCFWIAVFGVFGRVADALNANHNFAASRAGVNFAVADNFGVLPICLLHFSLPNCVLGIMVSHYSSLSSAFLVDGSTLPLLWIQKAFPSRNS